MRKNVTIQVDDEELNTLKQACNLIADIADMYDAANKVSANAIGEIVNVDPTMVEVLKALKANLNSFELK